LNSVSLIVGASMFVLLFLTFIFAIFSMAYLKNLALSFSLFWPLLIQSLQQSLLKCWTSL